VTLGAISADGITYTPLTGDMICKSYIDSMQNFSDGLGGWNWEVLGGGSLKPFDNDSTVGLSVNARTFGVQLDALEPALASFLSLNNVFVEIMDFTERNGNTITDWKMGAFFDNDVHFFNPTGGYDTVQIDRTISSAWTYTGDADVGATDQVLGWTKLPFGCGEEAIKSIIAIERQQSMTSATDVYWDSVYFYMSLGTGVPHGHTMLGSDDQDCMVTWLEKATINPNEEFSFAVVQFQYGGVVDGNVGDPRITRQANLTNKMIGFGRGDVNDDDLINLSDIIYLSDHVNLGNPGPIPFIHLGDIDASGGAPDMTDVNALVDFYFNSGPCPAGSYEI
jgi:hypothetical protein